MDMKLVSAAVKVNLSLRRAVNRIGKLSRDLGRLTENMNTEEHNEYLKRIA